MKFTLRRVSGLSIDNPVEDYRVPYAERRTREERIIDLNSLEELTSLMNKYDCNLVIEQPTKHSILPAINIYDGYYE